MPGDRSDHARLLAQIQWRRNDPEFMRRLRQMIDDDRDVLERLADGPVELSKHDAIELARNLRALASFGQSKLSADQVERACSWADRLYPLHAGPWRPAKPAPLSACTCEPGGPDDIRHDAGCPCRAPSVAKLPEVPRVGSR